MKTGRRRLLADNGGIAAVEFALIALPLLLLLLGIMEFGRVIWVQTTLHTAVEDAARCASVNTVQCGSTTAVQNYAVGRANGLSLASSVFTVSAQICGNQVTANFPFHLMIGDLFPAPITLTAQACFPR